jgi:hypothetical protein
MAKGGNQHQTRGKVERTPLTSQVKPNSGKVHSRQVGICIDWSTRNSAEVYTTHTITIIDVVHRLGWFRATFQLDMMPPYHSDLGPCRSTTGMLRLWDIVPGPQRSLRCLRRVWVLMPVPPYTTYQQPSSSGTTLTGRTSVPFPW